MQETSPILSLPYILPAQAQKHVTHNEALRVLDCLVQLVVIDQELQTPPDMPSQGDCYIIPDGGNGLWSDKTHSIAVWEDSAWVFILPRAGWRAYNLARNSSVVFDPQSGWSVIALGDAEADQLGIGATADSFNRLAVSADATLLTHAGTNHQLKINKSSLSDTASLLFQTAYSGRAEMGIAGEDAFSIKVSEDGVTWIEALKIAPITGAVQINGIVAGNAVTASGDDVTPDRLIRVQDGYVKSNVVGNVTQNDGVPTGAIVERGSNQDGDYVRFADGTQICTNRIAAAFDAGGQLKAQWSFPIEFISPPKCHALSDFQDLTNNATPTPNEILGVQGAAVSGQSIDFYVLRIAGGTDFAVADAAQLDVTAIGRWF